MNKKLFVGSLPYSVKGNELENLFSQFGTVDSATVINDKITRRSKGFGFVEMSSVTEANAAIQALNGKDFNGRQIIVSQAKERTESRERNW